MKVAERLPAKRLFILCPLLTLDEGVVFSLREVKKVMTQPCCHQGGAGAVRWIDGSEVKGREEAKVGKPGKVNNV